MNNSTSPVSDDRIPVIVGIGEIVDRPKEIAAGLEPLALLEEALKRAEADSGGKLLGEIQSLDIVSFLSWRYRDPEVLLSAARRRNPPRPRPNAPASNCRGRRSRMMSPSPSAAPRSRSRWR